MGKLLALTRVGKPCQSAVPRRMRERFRTTMVVAGRDTNGRAGRGPVALAGRLVDGGVRLLASWMLFWQISTAPVDVHYDASEAVVWAQHFAFGYKHPPLTGWLFALWFSVFPRQQWAMNLLTVTTSAVALAVSWRLFRDHLDKNRALLGLFALMLIPLYD